MFNRNLKEDIISAGREAVKELIKVAKEPIVTGDNETDLSADKMKSAAQAKRIAIEDALFILERIEREEQSMSDSKIPLKVSSSEGFAERMAR